MKKVFYTNVRYTAITKFRYESGEYVWLRQGNLSIAEAKKLYISVNQNKGAKAHKVGNLWFYGHMPKGENGTVEAIILEEVRPFYFE